MELTMIVALVLTVPVILIPVAFVWYLNIGGIVHALREVKTAKEKKAALAKTISQETLIEVAGEKATLKAKKK